MGYLFSPECSSSFSFFYGEHITWNRREGKKEEEGEKEKWQQLLGDGATVIAASNTAINLDCARELA